MVQSVLKKTFFLFQNRGYGYAGRAIAVFGSGSLDLFGMCRNILGSVRAKALTSTFGFCKTAFFLFLSIPILP